MTEAEIESALVSYFEARERTCAWMPRLAEYMAGQLATAEVNSMRQHLVTCNECREMRLGVVDGIDAWNSPRKSFFPTEFPPTLRLFTLVAVGAAAVGLLVVAMPNVRAGSERLTPKGAWSLNVAVQRGDKQFLSTSGTRLQSGDQLGLFYSSPSDGYLSVWYVDEHAKLLRIFPALSPVAAKAVAGEKIPLPDGAVLSAGKGCEWVVGIFTPNPQATRDAEKLIHAMFKDKQGCTLGTVRQSSASVQVVTVQR